MILKKLEKNHSITTQLRGGCNIVYTEYLQS